MCEALVAQAGFETRVARARWRGGYLAAFAQRRRAGGGGAVQALAGQAGAGGSYARVSGVMTHHKLARGTYATSSTFTPDALAFAQTNGINALDGARLLEQIARRTSEQQAALLAVAFEGEYWRPTCPGNWGQIPIKNLYEGYNPMTHDDAVAREIEVGIDLRSAGMGVWQT